MTPNQSKDIILRMVANFPGLYTDQEVAGADLVEWVSNEIHALKPDPQLKRRAFHGSPSDEELQRIETLDGRYREAARDRYERDGTIEIDDDAVVSHSEDPGAYVQAWVWVYQEDLRDS